MAKLINEVYRMQQLAGINEANEMEPAANTDQSADNQDTNNQKIDSKTELVKQLINITKMLNQSKINPSTSEIKAISDVIQTLLANVNNKELGPQLNKVNALAQNLTTKK
jgi:hypothetical protein